MTEQQKKMLIMVGGISYGTAAWYLSISPKEKNKLIGMSMFGIAGLGLLVYIFIKKGEEKEIKK